MILTIALVAVIAFTLYMLIDEVRYGSDEDSMHDRIVWALEEAGWSIVKKGLLICAISFGIALVVEGILYIVHFFTDTDILTVVDHFFVNVIKGSFYAALLGIYLRIIISLGINGFMLPFENYVASVRTVYQRYEAGKVFAFICQIAEKVILIGMFIFCIAILYPQVRARMVLDYYYEAGCLDELYKNGSIQEGNEAYLADSIFYEGIWRYKLPDVDEDSYYPYYIARTRNGSYDILPASLKKRTCYLANVGGQLIGVSGEDTVGMRTMSGLLYMESDCEWRKLVQTENSYDFEKIYSILTEASDHGISVEKAAAIVGVMQEHILLGVDDKQRAVFLDNSKSDGTYFIYMTREGEQVFGPYDVNQDVNMKAIHDQVLAVTSEGMLAHISMETGEMETYRLSGTTGEEIESFNYFVYEKDGEEETKVVAATASIVCAFDMSDPSNAVQVVELNFEQQAKVSSLYVSQQQIWFRFDEDKRGWVGIEQSSLPVEIFNAIKNKIMGKKQDTYL